MITVVSYGDWEQIFADDGTLLLEGHSISAVDLIRALEVDVRQIDMSDLPNDNYQVDNIAEKRSLVAVLAAKGLT